MPFFCRGQFSKIPSPKITKKNAIFPDNPSFWPLLLFSEKTPGGSQIIKKWFPDCQLAFFKNNILWKKTLLVEWNSSNSSFWKYPFQALFNAWICFFEILGRYEIEYNSYIWVLCNMITEGILFKNPKNLNPSEDFISSTGTHRFKPTHKKKTAPKPRSQRKTYLQWRSSFS